MFSPEGMVIGLWWNKKVGVGSSLAGGGRRRRCG